MNKNIDYSLYLVSDRQLLRGNSLAKAVEESILGGVTLVQLREKTASSLEFYEIALQIKKVTARYQVPLIINDRVDIALAVNAEGVHVGQEDLPAGKVREIIGKNKILGVSVSTFEEALKAQREGADYLGVGAMFATATKDNARISSLDCLKKIKAQVDLPVVVIGGINKETIPLFKDINIDGLAVVSAILAEENIRQAAKELKNLFLQKV